MRWEMPNSDADALDAPMTLSVAWALHVVPIISLFLHLRYIPGWYRDWVLYAQTS